MKNIFLLLISLASLGVTLVGCVNTVSGNKTAGVPWLNDRVEARYERSLDQVFNAAKDVIIRNGTISSAGTLFNQTNDVRVIEGKVKQQNVWLRIEALDPRLTAVTVQTRTSKGGADMPLAHEIDKEIALELAR
jgi:hypothetical protein